MGKSLFDKDKIKQTNFYNNFCALFNFGRYIYNIITGKIVYKSKKRDQLQKKKKKAYRSSTTATFTKT